MRDIPRHPTKLFAVFMAGFASIRFFVLRLGFCESSYALVRFQLDDDRFRNSFAGAFPNYLLRASAPLREPLPLLGAALSPRKSVFLPAVERAVPHVSFRVLFFNRPPDRHCIPEQPRRCFHTAPALSPWLRREALAGVADPVATISDKTLLLPQEGGWRRISRDLGAGSEANS